MNYFWDHQKNKNNIEKHGIDFSDALEMFKYPMLTCIDNRKRLWRREMGRNRFFKRNYSSHCVY